MLHIRQFALQIKASYWFIPALLSLGAVLLSLATWAMDRNWSPKISEILGWHAVSTPDGARQLLSTIATGEISVAGTVFAITIAAVVYASGTYGPRLLFNFMTDRGNQFALGIFIATYLYCLMVLRTVRGVGTQGDSFVPEVSLLVAIIFALGSVGTLVYFLHHVPASIRINSVVAAIGRQAMDAVKARYCEQGQAEPSRSEPVQCRAILCEKTGYIELVDFAGLAELANSEAVRIFLDCRTGDFLHPGMALLRIEGGLSDEFDEALRGAFAFGSQRTAEQDIEYLIDELVEIALRALSPSMNDPFTAITALFWIGAVTGELACRKLNRDPDGKLSSERGVFPLCDDFDHFVQRGFGGVMPSAATHPMVARIFSERLAQVAACGCGPKRRKVLRDQLERFHAQGRLHLQGPVLEGMEASVAAARTVLERD